MSEPAPKSRNSLADFQKRLFASRFFTVSVLLHFILVVTFGGTVLFQTISDPDDFTGGEGTGGLVESDVVAAPPPSEVAPTEVAPQPDMVAPTVMPTVPSDITAITTSAPSDIAFTLPQIAPPVVSPTNAIANAAPPPPVTPNVGAASAQLTAAQATQIGQFTKGWTGKGGPGPGSSAKQREFEFTAYLAKYGDSRDKQRGGNWASTVWLRDNKIVGGSLPNLLYLMNKMSGNRIKANPNPVPLDLSSKDIFTHRPPFIFFTGHRDFVLSDKEVENLREYINMGGCIWGDSSLPGRRSRFDIAFRREMRRIISDADKDWEVLPNNHPLYTHTRNVYYPEIKEPPPGMNYYQEPVYTLKYAGEVAILYTANDYGDMWQFGLDEKGKWDYSVDEKGNRLALNSTMMRHRGTYFRNVDEASVMNSFKFGTNVVIHLLTRWEDRLRTAPRGL